jgi:hypothetical protein
MAWQFVQQHGWSQNIRLGRWRSIVLDVECYNIGASFKKELDVDYGSVVPGRTKGLSCPTTRHEGACGERIYILILDLGPRWGWVIRVTPRPRFSPRKKTPGTSWTGGWVGPRAGLDTEVRGKILSPLSGIKPRSPGHPARSQALYWLSYPAHA